MRKTLFRRSLLLVLLLPLAEACTHELAVKNLDLYSAPTRLEGGDRRINVADRLRAASKRGAGAPHHAAGRDALGAKRSDQLAAVVELA